MACRANVDGEPVEFHGLGSYIIHTIDGDDYVGTVAAAFNKRPVVSLHNSRRPP